jgi:hypothetical protein
MMLHFSSSAVVAAPPARLLVVVCVCMVEGPVFVGNLFEVGRPGHRNVGGYRDSRERADERLGVFGKACGR